MPDEIDVGEPTGDAAELSDDELDMILDGEDTKQLDAAVDKQYGNYLDKWAKQIEGGK